MTAVRLHVDKPVSAGAILGALGWVYRVDEPAGGSNRRLVQVAGPLALPVGWDVRDTAPPISLPPGEYMVRVRMPAGEEVVDGFSVPADSDATLDVAIEASASPHEWLSDDHMMGAVPSDAALRAISVPRSREDLQVQARRAGTAAGEPAEARGRFAARMRSDWQRHTTASRQRLAALTDAGIVAWVVRSGPVAPDNNAGSPGRLPRSERGWLRYWLGGIAAAQPATPTVSDDLFARTQLGPWVPELLEPTPAALRQIFDEGMPAGAARSYFVVPHDDDCTCVGVLPLPWPQVGDGPDSGFPVPIGLTVRYEQAARFSSEGDGRSPSRLRATVSPADPAALPLLGYLGSGNFEAADTVIAASRESLARKVRNPFAAAAMAYVITEAVESLGSLDSAPKDWNRWIGALADGWPMIPDGAIARGWLRLQEASRLERVDGEHSERAAAMVEAARADLLEAVHRGMPYYAHGVQLLVEGLTMIAGGDGRQDRSPLARETRAARTACRWLSMRTDPREVFTTLLL